MSWNGFKLKSKKTAERLENRFQNLNLEDGGDTEDNVTGEATEATEATTSNEVIDSCTTHQTVIAAGDREDGEHDAAGELDEWEIAGAKQKAEAKRLGIQRADKRKAAKEAAQRKEEERIRKLQAEAEEAFREQERKKENDRLREERRDAERARRRQAKEDEQYRRKTKGIDIMIDWFKKVLNDEIPDDELPIVVVCDTESGKKFVIDKLKDFVTEVGLTIVPLWIVRKHIRGGKTFLEAWAASTVTCHLRLLEHAKILPVDERDRTERWLWQAAFAEFGSSHWIHVADLPRAMKDAVFDAAGLMAQRGPTFRRPEEAEATKPKMIFSGHALKNDEAPIEALGFKWADHFEVVSRVDTQEMCWWFSGNDHRPPLHRLMERCNISIIRKHHGGNDAAYTAFILGAVALRYAQFDNIFEVAGDPRADIGPLVDTYRLAIYRESSCGHINGAEVCNTCGDPHHDKLECYFRCLYCHMAQRTMRKLGEKFHNYLTCPVRLRDEQDEDRSDEQSRLLKLHGTSKGFIMSAHDQNRLEGQRRRSRPQGEAASSTLQYRVKTVKKDPRIEDKNDAHNSKDGFDRDDNDFPRL